VPQVVRALLGLGAAAGSLHWFARHIVGAVNTTLPASARAVPVAIAAVQSTLTGDWRERHIFWGKGLHGVEVAGVISVLTLSVTQASLSQAHSSVSSSTEPHIANAVVRSAPAATA
jgi:hypothetical protein